MVSMRMTSTLAMAAPFAATAQTAAPIVAKSLPNAFCCYPASGLPHALASFYGVGAAVSPAIVAIAL